MQDAQPQQQTHLNLSPVFLAQSKLRRRQFDACADICTKALEKNPLDQAVWYLKCRALTLKTMIDDTEQETEPIGDAVLDDNVIANLPRPGTSLARPLTTSGTQTPSVRPMTSSGRPVTGFARPGTMLPPSTGSNMAEAFGGARPGTAARPITSSGRMVRLGTASMEAAAGGPFVQVERLNLRKYASRPSLSKVMFEYLYHYETNVPKALELASLCTTAAEYQDWWWKAQVGKCYYRLGLPRDADRQFRSSINSQEMISTYMHICKVFVRMDQPTMALEFFLKALEQYPGEAALLLGVARICDALNDNSRSIEFYKKALSYEATNVEAIACLASNFFYNDQPELALRYFRRLLQMGVSNSELWNNLGLCCFYAQQYDMTLGCFERALAMADDDNMADIWFNIGQVAIGIGDMSLAYQACKVAVSINALHAESYTNLGVLELRKGNVEAARSSFQTASKLAPFLHEPLFNQALLHFKMGDFQESYNLVTQALAQYPNHEDSKELLATLQNHFVSI